LESQLQEISAKLLDTERTKNDITEKAIKLQNELESVSLNFHHLEKAKRSLENLVAEQKAQIEELELQRKENALLAGINSFPILLRDKYVNEFSEQNLISCGGFGIVYEVIHKYSKKIYAIKRIALNEKELEKAFKELNLMKGLKSPYVVKHIDSWIEENSVQFKAQLSSNISFSHRICDPKNTVLLHIQMEFCCQTLNKVMEQLSNKMKKMIHKI
jgi:hypothetical protein